MQASILGLGCSRLGSIFGGDDTATRNLFAAARDTGVTFFDTADIYGQGDSERLIGRLLPRTGDIVVATKIGQRWPLALRSIRFLKTPLGPVLRSVPRARHTVQAARAKELPRDFSPRYLRLAVEASLARLRRERVDLLFLHGPDAETLRRGEALACLSALKRAGKIGAIGVSTDGREALRLSLADPCVDAVQCRWAPDVPDADMLELATRRQVAVIAREVLGGPAAPSSGRDAASVIASFRAAVATPGVAVVLLGTTKPVHLTQIAAALSRQVPTGAR